MSEFKYIIMKVTTIDGSLRYESPQINSAPAFYDLESATVYAQNFLRQFPDQTVAIFELTCKYHTSLIMIKSDPE